MLGTLPNTSERAGLELALQLRLGYAVRITKGYADPEPGRCMARARELLDKGPTAGEEDPMPGADAFDVMVLYSKSVPKDVPGPAGADGANARSP